MLVIIVPIEKKLELNHHKPNIQASYSGFMVRLYDRSRCSEIPLNTQRLDCCTEAPTKVIHYETIQEATNFLNWFYMLSFENKRKFLNNEIFYVEDS